VIPLAHIGGVPVEETLQPLAIALMLSGAWLTTRFRRSSHTLRKERTPSDGIR
jgi:hypothetical protein